MIELPEPITVQHDGQDYRLIGSRLHARRDGTPTWLLVWESDCPACGDEFEALTPRLFRYPKRFCDGCRETIGQKTVRTWRRQQAKESGYGPAGERTLDDAAEADPAAPPDQRGTAGDV